jgi:hypothetical protein
MRNKAQDYILYLICMLTFFMLGTLISLYLTSDMISHKYIVESHGYKDVGVLGLAWFSCTDRDSIFKSRKFIATTTSDLPVSGSVCCGWFTRDCYMRINSW